MSKTNVLITGANGFIGAALFQFLKDKPNYFLRLAVRRKKDIYDTENYEQIIVDNVDEHTDWSISLRDCDCVVHALGRAHVLKESSKNPLKEFKKINTDSTLNLANQAAKAGVKRFIFISSIGVNGSKTQNGQKFTEKTAPTPYSDYAFSKLEAEEGLLNIARSTRLEVTIIRPPLVYGPQAKGNFSSLLKLIQCPIPLPFKLIQNKRSFISIYNLCDFIELCMAHPKAANELFLISDDYDLSTAEFCQLLAQSINQKISIIPIPVTLLNRIAKLLRKKQVVERLISSLQIDITHAKNTLGWFPPFSIQSSLSKMFEEFK